MNIKDYNYLRIILIIFILWSIISAISIVSYMVLAEWIWQGWYYIIWPIFAGGLIWKYKVQIKTRLVKWRLPTVLKYVLIVYAMVLVEEVVASTLNHLAEGFDFSLYIKRIGQFWALNILAFSGMAWGSYLVMSRYSFTRIEMFCIFGLFGQISEHLIYRLFFVPEEAMAAFVLIPLNFLAYGFIFLPAIFIIEDKERIKLSIWLRYLLALGVLFLVSIPFIAILDISRLAYPELFPPRSMIP